MIRTKEPTIQPRQKEGDAPPTIRGRLPPKTPELKVVHYEEGRYVVVDKPPDVRIDGEFTQTVEKLVLSYINSLGFNVQDAKRKTGFGVRFIHRLDYATSGVMLIGLTRKAAGVAATQFEKRTVMKRYLALVHGHVAAVGKQSACRDKDKAFLTFDQAIAETDPPGYKMTVGTPANPGRASLTKCYPLANGSYKGAPVTKVLLEPYSGRRHQLRVHCANAGMPIVGDATYIDDDSLYFNDPDVLPPRMMLHAHELILSLPPADERLYGRKSGLRNAVRQQFVTADPFCEENLEGMSLSM